MSYNTEVFLPSKSRYLLLKIPADIASIFVLTFVAYTLLNIALDLRTSWLPVAAGTAAAYLIFHGTRYESYSIRLTSAEVSGTSLGGWRGITIPIQQVDIDRSRKSNPFQIVLGNYVIRTTDGKQIRVDRFAFGKGQYEYLLQAIEFRQKLLSA